MSTLLESISQISSEYSDLTLQEMPIDYKSPFLHSEIASTLKHMVSSGHRKAEIRKSSSLEKFSISFQIPADCIINKIDMDKVVLSYQNFTQLRAEGKTNLTRQFSFKERMEGWNVERRQRENGTYDVVNLIDAQ
ncbi:hypothetical protein VNO77_08660 [Canavalia gladiata]|uniref:Uncharacterized protein n=1 Tax=Canavalia gladiata TaxID=3824 RepID=A0AAN9QWP2_CANGL